MVHVPHIQREPVLPRKRVPAVHLRPTGNAGLDFVPARLEGGVPVEIFRQERPRPHQAHISADHVEELWQLIKTRTTEKAAERGQPRFVRQEIALAIPRIAHRPELEYREGLSMKPGANLPEQHGRAQIKKLSENK